MWDLQLVLIRRNGCKYRHNSEHAYAENVVVVMQQKLSAGACFSCPLIANTYSYHIVQAIHLHN